MGISLHFTSCKFLMQRRIYFDKLFDVFSSVNCVCLSPYWMNLIPTVPQTASQLNCTRRIAESMKSESTRLSRSRGYLKTSASQSRQPAVRQPRAQPPPLQPPSPALKQRRQQPSLWQQPTQQPMRTKQLRAWKLQEQRPKQLQTQDRIEI